MNKVQFNNPFCVDVDDTLIMWDLSAYPTLKRIIVQEPGSGFDAVVIPNEKNINTLVKLARMGYDVVVWSQTGADWAKAVVETLGIDAFVKAYMTKPKFYMDDLPAREWMTNRIWKDPVTGVERAGSFYADVASTSVIGSSAPAVPSGNILSES